MVVAVGSDLIVYFDRDVLLYPGGGAYNQKMDASHAPSINEDFAKER